VDRCRGLDTSVRARRTRVSPLRRPSRLDCVPNDVTDVFDRSCDDRLRRVEIIGFEHDPRSEFVAFEPQAYQHDGHPCRGRAEHLISIYTFASLRCFPSVADDAASRQRMNCALTSR
jgi:hypothetical protein